MIHFNSCICLNIEYILLNVFFFSLQKLNVITVNCIYFRTLKVTYNFICFVFFTNVKNNKHLLLKGNGISLKLQFYNCLEFIQIFYFLPFGLELEILRSDMLNSSSESSCVSSKKGKKKINKKKRCIHYFIWEFGVKVSIQTEKKKWKYFNSHDPPVPVS